MDDWSLEKLSAKPAKLSPAFKSKVFEYSATVSSAIEKVNIDCLTTDSGASYQIKVRFVAGTAMDAIITKQSSVAL